MANGEEFDSGMESHNSKGDTPDRRAIMDNYDDDEDETLAERLWGLTEMFPEPVRNFTYRVTTNIGAGIKASYTFSRQATWFICTTSLFLIAPVMLEVERANTQEALRRDQHQVLLGPNAALSSSSR